MINNLFYRLVKLLAAILFGCFYSIKTRGMQNLPACGAVIIASNHESYLDAVIITLCVKRRIRWIALKQLYKVRFISWILDISQAIPTGGSLRRALRALKNGAAVGIFPEGMRTPDGKLQQPQKGSAWLALKAGACVVPAGIEGAYEAYPASAKLPKIFKKISVNFGPAVIFEKSTDRKITRDKIDCASNLIMRSIAALLQENS